jgi:hypothetical protein
MLLPLGAQPVELMAGLVLLLLCFIANNRHLFDVWVVAHIYLPSVRPYLLTAKPTALIGNELDWNYAEQIVR